VHDEAKDIEHDEVLRRIDHDHDYSGQALRMRLYKNSTQFSDFQCNICGFYFISKAALDAHTKIHLDPPQYQCGDCGKIFKRDSSFFTHLYNENCKIKEVGCKVCGLSYKSSLQLKKHRKVHHSGEYRVPWFHCEVCPEKFKSYSAFKKHQESCKKIFVCDHCGREFTKKSRIFQHIRMHAIHKVECKICHAFVSARSLPKHMMILHDSKLKRIICDVCGKSFKKFYFKNHRKIHEVKKFECNLCDLKFISQGKLSFHMKYHENPDEFKCEICGIQKTTKGNLRIHKWRAHERNLDNFKCQECGRKFSDNKVLERHIKGHEEMAKKNGHRPRFECEFCKIKFLLQKSLSNHLINKH
jgi:KRAB domain-containing zinc finger protein